MSSARTRPRFLTVLVTVGLIAGFVISAPMPTRVLAEPAPDPGLRAQLMSSGLGVDVEGWNWAWDESSGVELKLFAPDGSGPVATAEGFPSPLEHGHHFWAIFDTTFGPDHRIVATGRDSGITREVIVRDIRISHTDRLAGTVTGTAASADPVTVIANADASGDWLSRLATPTDADLDGVFEWAVDFTTAAGIDESGDPLVPPIDVLTGDAQLGSTGAKFSTPRILLQTSGQQWWANIDWLDHLDHDVYLAFDNGAQHFETDAVSPWINELGNGSENFDLNSIDELVDAFGDGADWTVSVVADADDAVLAWVTLPLLTLDSVNTTTGEITGQADDGFEVSTGGVDGYDSTRFDGTSSPWTWTSDVAERNISVMWNSMAGNGHDYHVGYAWPSFTYTLNYDEGADGFHHFLSSLGGAPLGVRGEFPEGSVTITVDDPADTYDDTFHVDTYVPPDDYATGFEVDLQSQGIPPDAVGPGWTFTAAVDIGGVPMSKTLIIDEVSVTTVDIQNGIASGTCTFEEQEWIVQVEHDGWGENLYPECSVDDTWEVGFDTSQPISHVQASYQDGDLDVNTAGFYPIVENEGDPWIAAIVRSGTVQFHGQWSGDPINITIDGVSQGNFNYDDCSSGCDWLPVNAGSEIVVSDGTTTKELTVTDLSLLGVDPEASTIKGTSSSGRDIEILNWGGTLTIPHDGTGVWTADFSLTDPFNGQADGWAGQTDDEGDQTWVWWTTPRLQVGPHGSVVGQGGWYVGDTVTVETYNSAGQYLTTFEVVAGSREVDQSNEFEHGSWEIDNLGEFGVGYTVVARDHQTTRTHEVRPVMVGEIDTDLDTVSGTTTLQSGDHLTVQANHCSRDDMSVTDGGYTADFSAPGPQPHEQDTCDLDPGSSGQVQHFDDDGDFTILSWNIPTEPDGNPPTITAIVRSGTVQFQGDWSGEPMSITIDGVDQGDFSYDDCAQGCDWLPVNAGSLIVVSDGTTTKELTVTNLSLLGVDPVASIIEGTSSAGRDVEVWNWGDTLTIPDDGTGTWTADFSLTNPFNGDASGAASQTDDEGDQTWLFWGTPRMHVEPNGVVVGQGGWYEGDTVVVETFNPGDDYLTDDYLNRFEVTAGSSDIGPQDSWRIDDLGEFGVGDTVVASDRQTTRVHVVRPVTVGEIDTEFDTVSGTTTLQLDDRLQVQADHCSRDDVPATAGSYTADFSVPGAQPHEQNTCDLDPGSSGQVQHFDDDGDFTILWWNLPEHRQIEVYPEFDLVGGWDAELTLTVERGGNKVYPDGPGPATGYNGFALWEDGFDLLPGDLVTVSDGETTKDHLVRSHTITSLTEAPGNTVAGTALPGTTLFIRHNTIESQLSDDNIESATIVVDGTGNWDYPFTNDVGPGTAVEVIEFDLPNSDNDQTFVVAYIPNPPTFMASLDDGSFFGDGWPVGDVVTISVDDPATTEPVDYTVDPYPTEQRGFPWDTHFNTDGGWDLQPGYVVTVTTDPDGDGTPDLEKTLTVVDLTLEGIDPEAAVVTGRAEPGATVYVFAQNEWEFAWRNVVAEPAGSGDPGFWMADLSMLGPDDDGDGTVGLPLAPNTGFAAQVFDIDGDATNYGGCFECEGGGHPWLAVILGPYGAGISGEQFGTDGPFTITLDDPATPDDGPDHTWVVPDDFPEGGALVGDGFWLYGPFQDGSVQLTPGHVVTVTDMSNDTYREHTIRDLSYDDVDLTTNTVSGWSGSPEMVNVSIGNPEQWRTPQVNASDTPNANGNWTVDFSSFTNVLPLIGLEGLISIPDDDDTPGDQTGILWGPPFIAAGIDVDGPDPRVIDAVWGGFWLHDDTVEMKVFDPDDLTQPKFGPVQGTVDKSWFNGFQLEQQPTELEVGDVVHVRGLQSGDELTHTVLDLQVDGWEWAAVDEEGNHLLDENGDPIGNRVWGTAQPTGHTGIIKLRIDDDLGMRMVDVALDGTWVVDFNLPPDEEGEWGDEVRLGPGMGGSVHLRGDDGNLAWAPWGEHGGGEGPGELHLHAMAYGNEWLSGEGLPSGMYVIQIEGAGECSNLVYRQGSEFHVDAAELCDDGDLKPDHHVVVSAVAEDGVSPGQLIAEFTIDGVVISGADVDTRTVWGLATDGKPVTVALFDESTEEPVAWRTVDLANGESEWSVDFLTAPNPETEENWGTGALAGRSVWAAQFDGQGHTESDWMEVEPRLFVNLIEDFVQLNGWPGDVPAVLRILESDAANAEVVYEEQIVAGSPYYVLFAQLDLGGFDVLAGQHVVASADDGSVEVAHTVSEISITGVDFELDLLAGTATNGADHHLFVGVGNESGEAELEPAGSPWTADFNGLVDFSATNTIEGFVAEFDAGESATFFQFEAEYQEFVVPPGGGSVGTDDGTVVIGNLGDGDGVGIVVGSIPPSTSEFDYVGGTYELIWEGAPRTFDDPLILTFRIPGDEIPAGLNLDAIFVFKDGIEAPDCPAVPDSDGDFPCVLERIRDGASGDVLITVQALTAGVWIAAIPGGGVDPHLHAVVYGADWISGEGLPPAGYVLWIDDAAECPSLLYLSGSEFLVEGTELCADGDLQPDHHVVVSTIGSDGLPYRTIAEFTIDGVVISGADVDTRTVWGLATDGKPVTIGLFDENTGEPVAWRTVDLADEEYEWSVDFSTAPNPETENNWGVGALAGRSVWAAQFDAQGHTESDWVDVEPHIYVNRITDAVVLENWPTGEPITLEVFASDNVGALRLYAESTPAPGPYYVLNNHTELGGFDLLAGQYVVATAGLVEVAHSVAAIGVESFDFVEDSYDGIATAEPGSTVRTGVWYEQGGRQEGHIELPGTPEWTADFTEQGLDFSATNRIEGYVAEFDLGGNATFYEFAAEYEVLTNDDGTATSGNGGVTVTGLEGSDNITMTETDSSDVGDGFQTVGTTVDVDGTDDDGNPIVRDFEAGDQPLILILRILGDDMPDGLSLEDILVFRNGVEVPSCPDVLQSNNDFPCVSTREWVNGDVELTVQTLAFSSWTMAFRLVDIAGFSATAEPIAVGSPVGASGSFDAGATDFTAVIHWADGSCSVTGVDNAAFHTTHEYTDPGVYTPVLEVYAGSRTCADVAGEDPIDSATYRYVVVYDSDGGFVTGGGWIDSQAGAYALDPELTGRANFGFVAKYKKGKSTPAGNTNFQFQTADLHFESTAYDWLVITGGEKAKYKGVGTINGEGFYGFMLTAIDSDDGDTFRIKIWDEATGHSVYDNWLGAGDDSYDGTTLGGGSIVVHTAKSK